MKKSAAFLVLAAICCLPLHAAHNGDWHHATLVKTSTVNTWCRHCPDWNQTFYSFKCDDGTTYTARTHRALNLTVNASTKVRFENDGAVGDSLHVLDNSGKDQKLKITGKAAEK